MIKDKLLNQITERQKEGLERERDRVLTEVETQLDTIKQIDDNLQYYLWLEDVESCIESLRGKQPENPCVWTEDGDGAYITSCGNIWVFFDGTPTDNGLVFCPFCGGIVRGEP